MPTYEFRCPNGHLFDKFFRSMSAATAEAPCAECGAVATRQISGGAGLLFKGSGFYLTDYGKNAHRGGPSSPASSDKGKNESGGKGEGGGAKSESGSGGGGEGGGGKPSGGESKSSGGEGKSAGSSGSSSSGSSSGGDKS